MLRIRRPSVGRLVGVGRAWLLVMLVMASPASAWSGTGHRVIGTLAAEEIRPATRARIEALLAVIDAGSSLAEGAVWMDEIRARDLRAFDRWHYINLPHTIEGQPSVPPKTENVVWAIEKARETLADDTLSPRRQAFYVAVLLHTVGDIHQPMHCVGRISPAHPEGDRGGNDFLLGERYRNLHRLWDRTADLLPHVTAEDHEALAAHAQALARRYPRASLRGVEVDDPHDWADESYRLAVEVAYRDLAEGVTPSDAYLERVRETVGPRLALAAYRLADLLEALLGEAPPPDASR